MTATTVRPAGPRLVLVSDDAILAGFLARSGLAGAGAAPMVLAPAAAADRLAGLRAPDALVMDRAGFDALEPRLPALPAQLPRILVADPIDTATARRLLAAGGTAAIPTSHDRPRFLAALALAMTGEPVLPPGLWLPCLKDRLATRPAEGADSLTPRERDVLCELANGKSNKLIAHSLGIAEPTVKMHLAHIARKLGVANRTQLLTRAIRRGFLPELATAGSPP